MKLRRAFPLLAGTILVGTIAAYLEMTGSTAQSSDRPVNPGDAARRVAARSEGATPDSSAPAGNPLWAIPLEQLSTTRDRPLFSPTRHPPPVIALAPVPTLTPSLPRPEASDRPEISLLGTIVNGSEGIGLFMQSATRAVVRLRMGEDHQGWVLRSVGSREVTLVKDSKKTVLELPSPSRDMAMLPNDPTLAPQARPPRQ